MPLSEDEQRILAQIELGLTRDDPRFAGTVDLSRRRRRRIGLAVAAMTTGAVIVLAGLLTTQAAMVIGVVIGIAGALTMAVAATAFHGGLPRHLRR